jgi:adenylosuccinate synthase
VVVGTQYGDEGKGKVVDYYSETADIIIRYNGGANAGHTVVIKEDKFAFRLLPSGVLRRDKTVVLGNGVVIDPEVFFSEIDGLKHRGVIPAHILVSDRAHIVMPYHKLLDAVEEKLKGRLKAGTTKKGIGPCYSDKVARFGIRVCDLLDIYVLTDKLETFVPLKEKILTTYGEEVKLSRENLKEKYYEYGVKLSPYVIDTINFLNKAIRENKHLLFEGAQGTHLDIDYGIYPFGTSSNAVSGGVCTGSGIPPTKIDQVIGVVKAYTSRVGEGPFPTELKDDVGQYIREKGGEYGTVTKRPRRCGWLDLVMVDYSIRVNGISSLALTKMDVLSGLQEIKICTAYEHKGEMLNDFPANMSTLSECKPLYETFESWNECTKKHWYFIAKQGYDTLPETFRTYLEFIEKSVAVPINLISFGPERALTLKK